MFGFGIGIFVFISSDHGLTAHDISMASIDQVTPEESSPWVVHGEGVA